jgi:hypothetical protein
LRAVSTKPCLGLSERNVLRETYFRLRFCQKLVLIQADAQPSARADVAKECVRLPSVAGPGAADLDAEEAWNQQQTR